MRKTNTGLEVVYIFQMIGHMQAGQALNLTRNDLMAMVESNITSLLYDRARESDIEPMLDRLCQDQGFRYTLNPIDMSATLTKLH